MSLVESLIEKCPAFADKIGDRIGKSVELHPVTREDIYRTCGVDKYATCKVDRNHVAHVLMRRQPGEALSPKHKVKITLAIMEAVDAAAAHCSRHASLPRSHVDTVDAKVDRELIKLNLRSEAIAAEVFDPAVKLPTEWEYRKRNPLDEQVARACVRERCGE